MNTQLLVDPYKLVQDLADLIEKERAGWHGGPAWTDAVKRYLSDAYLKAGAQTVRCTHVERKISEFMIDFCAYSGKQMEIVVECEWKSQLEKTMEDFEKLLHMKAPVKLMICDSPPFVDDALGHVRRFFASYPDHRKGEQYMIFNCRCKPQTIFCHRWRPPFDGSVPPEAIRFEVVQGFPRFATRFRIDSLREEDVNPPTLLSPDAVMRRAIEDRTNAMVEEMMSWDSCDWHEHDMKPHGNFTRLEELSRKLQQEADREYQERQVRESGAK